MKGKTATHFHKRDNGFVSIHLALFHYVMDTTIQMHMHLAQWSTKRAGAIHFTEYSAFEMQELGLAKSLLPLHRKNPMSPNQVHPPQLYV